MLSGGDTLVSSADARHTASTMRGISATSPIEGIVAYPVTPFAGDSTLDLPRLAALINRLIDGGAHAIAPLGSTGESAYLTEREWDTVAEVSLSAVAGRRPAVVGIAHLTTAGAVRRARRAEAGGANALMLLPMSYWRLSDREIIRHFATVADSVGLPVIAYNNPATAGIDMSSELLAQLVRQIRNVTMVKESSGRISRLTRLLELTEGEVPIFNGSNPLALQALSAGAAGWCTAAACLIPEQCGALWTLVREGRLAAAEELFRSMRALLGFLVGHGGLPTTVKAGLAVDGFSVGDPRAPQLALGDEDTRALAAHLVTARGSRRGATA